MATSIEVPYNDDLKPFERALAGVRRPGNFVTQGSFEAPMPRIDVRDVGILSFPIPDAQVEALIAQCERAPYGRGRETVLDTTVRKVWQLAPPRFDIGGKSWSGTFDRILASVVDGLGCADASVSAELYKLLVYDEGAFFKAHRDTEKTEGMFGTLLIVLPSRHAGGQLVVRHTGREVAVDLSGDEVAELKFAAFYADCEHEVLRVTCGHRVCLVYNLLQQLRDKGKSTSQLVAPLYEAETAEVTKQLASAFARPGAPTKIAWLLEHQYSPAGLSFDVLKGADKARATVLRTAAARADCAIHLGIVHIEESGPAEYRGWESRAPRGWGRYHRPEEDASNEDFEVVEVSDGSSYIDNWRTSEDVSTDFGSLPLREGELLPSGALDDEPPDEQRLLEASGNEGVSFERAYHRAALLLWPRSRFIEVLLQSGVCATLPYLEMHAAAATSDAERQVVIGEARRVIEAWERRVIDRDDGRAAHLDFDSEGANEPVSEDRGADEDWHEVFGEEDDAGSASNRGSGDRIRMLALLQRLADAPSIERFIGSIVMAQFRGDEAAVLVGSAPLLGAALCGALFTRLIRQRMRAAPRGCMSLFVQMADEQRRAPRTPDWAAALSGIANAVVDGLPSLHRPPPARSSRSVGWKRWLRIDADTLADLLEALAAFGSRELQAAACAAITANSAAFDPRSVLVPALRSLRDRGATMIGNEDHERLWLHAADVLLARSEYPLPVPRDWRQETKLSCDCADCHELMVFAADPERQTHRFRMRQDRRVHLQGQIERHGLDMAHVTERKGSPQTLVCTKTRRRYERRLAAYRKDIGALSTLAELVGEASVGEHASRCERIAVARERAR